MRRRFSLQLVDRDEMRHEHPCIGCGKPVECAEAICFDQAYRNHMCTTCAVRMGSSNPSVRGLAEYVTDEVDAPVTLTSCAELDTWCDDRRHGDEPILSTALRQALTEHFKQLGTGVRLLPKPPSLVSTMKVALDVRAGDMLTVVEVGTVSLATSSRDIVVGTATHDAKRGQTVEVLMGNVPSARAESVLAILDDCVADDVKAQRAPMEAARMAGVVGPVPQTKVYAAKDVKVMIGGTEVDLTNATNPSPPPKQPTPFQVLVDDLAVQSEARTVARRLAEQINATVSTCGAVANGTEVTITQKTTGMQCTVDTTDDATHVTIDGDTVHIDIDPPEPQT